ncbi:MAG: glycosyltransferase family 39 protein [Pseudonocardia sp.]|nr:glycosyltransferase family 39 protein [Pseudonocardia sp.]
MTAASEETRGRASGKDAAGPLGPWQRRIVWTCWLVGGLARLIYLFLIHPAIAYVYSDMQGYVIRAEALAAGRPETISDTLYPPGASWFFGALLSLDPSWTLVSIGQWVLSLGTMGMVWLIARRVYGNAAAVVALVIATVYPPYFHYAALFLAENGFTFFVLGSSWLLLRAVGARSWFVSGVFALGSGLAAGLATAFKNTMIAPLVVTVLVYLLSAWRGRDLRVWSVAVSVVIGFAILFAPLSARCASLNEGRFCPGANNLAMNVLMGHYGEKREFRWVDSKRGYMFDFTAVESTLRGYTEPVTLDFGAYDSARNWALARKWVVEHPAQALSLSLRNVGSLFAARTLWPPLKWRGVDIGTLSQGFFLIVILPPALLQLVRRAPWRGSSALPQRLLVAPMSGLVLEVFVSITEVRFRVPFDGLLIVLAAPVWCLLCPALPSRPDEGRSGCSG